MGAPYAEVSPEAKGIGVCRALALAGLTCIAKRVREGVKSRGLLGLSHRDAQPTLTLIELELKEGTAFPLDGDRLFKRPLIEAVGELDFDRTALSIQRSHARREANVARALLAKAGLVEGAAWNLRYRRRKRITCSPFRCLCPGGQVCLLTRFIASLEVELRFKSSPWPMTATSRSPAAR